MSIEAWIVTEFVNYTAFMGVSHECDDTSSPRTFSPENIPLYSLHHATRSCPSSTKMECDLPRADSFSVEHARFFWRRARTARCTTKADIFQLRLCTVAVNVLGLSARSLAPIDNVHISSFKQLHLVTLATTTMTCGTSSSVAAVGG